MERQLDVVVLGSRQVQFNKQLVSFVQVAGAVAVQHGNIRIHSHALSVGVAIFGCAHS